jgi:predicted dehydrogenase
LEFRSEAILVDGPGADNAGRRYTAGVSAGALRVGVVGLNARVQRQVLPSLAASPRAVLAAVASRDLAKAEELAGPYPGCRAFGDYEKMLATGELDAVFVMTPPEQHAPMSLAAIERGLHVMCEKPLSVTLEESREMVRAAAGRGVRTAVNFTYRSSPGPRYVARLLANPGIGELLDVQIAYLQGRGLALPGPFRDPLSDLGAHAVDALFWWADAAGGGGLDGVAAFASRHTNGTPLSWTAAGSLAGGATVGLSISRVAAGRGNAVLATLCGGAGSLKLDFDVEAVRVSRAEAGGAEWRELPIPPELHVDYVTFPRVHFDRLVGALLGEEQFPTFEDGLRVQEAIAAAERSAASGLVVRLPLEAAQ